jgi:hypothetical protein
MKRTLALGLVWLFLGLPLGGQQSPPTVTQCQADRKYFAAEIERSSVQTLAARAKTRGHNSGPPRILDGLSARELNKRVVEMLACTAVDDDRLESYIETSDALTSVIETREYDFLKRHQLFSQFYAEDAKGLR